MKKRKPLQMLRLHKWSSVFCVQQQIALAAHHIIYMFSNVQSWQHRNGCNQWWTDCKSGCFEQFHYMARLSQPWVCGFDVCTLFFHSYESTIISSMQSMAWWNSFFLFLSSGVWADLNWFLGLRARERNIYMKKYAHIIEVDSNDAEENRI